MPEVGRTEEHVFRHGDAQRAEHVDQQVREFPAAARAVLQQVQRAQVGRVVIRQVGIAPPLQVAQHGVCRRYRVAARIERVQQVAEIAGIRLHPRFGRLVADAVVLIGVVPSPGPFAPRPEGLVYVPRQVVRRQGPRILLPGQDAVVEGLPAFRPCRSRTGLRPSGVRHHVLQAVHLRRVVVICLLHLRYQQAGGVQLLRVVPVMRQHGLQFAAVVAGHVEDVLHAAVQGIGAGSQQ